MVSEDYKNATGWGVVITFFIVIFYLGINIVFNPGLFTAPLPNWIVTGPVLFIAQSGLNIYLHLISRKEPTDPEDKMMIRKNRITLISSFLGFTIWLIVLVLLSIVHWDLNVYLSMICGVIVIYGIQFLVQEKKMNASGI